jgi:SAM-dependent methyltransferase
MWGVLAHDGMRGRWQPEEFFAHGRSEVDALMTQLQMAGVDPPRDRVLDFGCGVGRLSFALADRFERVVGVDISRPMLDGAGRYNRLGDRCQFFLYNGEDLSLFPDRSFSAVVSLMTLQHVPPAAATVYLSEMVRVLRPGGVLAVQIPAERRQSNLSPWRRLRRGIRTSLDLAIRRPPRMEMHAMPIEEVAAVIEAAGADIAGVIPDGRAGEWGESVLHVAVRRAPDRAGPPLA